MIFSLARWRRARPDVSAATTLGPAAPTPRADAATLAAVIRKFAQDASSLGKEGAELHGLIDDVKAAGARQGAACGELNGEVERMTAANRSIGTAIDGSMEHARAARNAVERVAADVGGAAASLREVAAAAGEITRIALQTRLVAFNALVEAKRAGEAGRGFSVVAEAVKDLAQQVEVTSKSITGTVQQLDQRIGELARDITEVAAQGARPTFNTAFGQVEAAVAQIAVQAQDNVQACASTRTAMGRLSEGLDSTLQAMAVAHGRAGEFRSLSEHLIELAADCGAETEDTPYIEQVCEAAARIGALFVAALGAGQISVADLFDADYRPVPGSQPQQHLTRFVALTDRLLPPIQEAMLKCSDKVVFCAAVDRNGFLPTHNRQFSQPPRTDPVWNAANCRNRRIFDDRTGLAAGRNERKFLLQTYRRDMGGGKFRLMKDLSAPIVVDGRHWGGLRLAYQF